MKTNRNPAEKQITTLKQLSEFVSPERLSGKMLLPQYPDCPGVYVLSDDTGKILYVGRSKQLCRRVSHLTAMQRDKSNKQGRSHIKADLVRDHQRDTGPVYISFLTAKTDTKAHELEKDIRRVIKREWNVR